MANGFARVVIKTAVPGFEHSRDGMIREYNTYQLPGVATSKDVRAMYDVVGTLQDLEDKDKDAYPGLVLEWLDTTLQDVPPEQYRHNLVLHHAIIRSVLSSSAVLHDEKLVNTGGDSQSFTGTGIALT